jgi:DNA (cytosine-5)-methyltransferase 1
MNFGSLFSGIGGLDLGLELAGMKCKWQVEIDSFCNKVLNKHWPKVPKYGNIKEIKKGSLEAVDIIAGGFPCQPFSTASAGLRKGEDDSRYLWPEMLRIVDEVKPSWVLGENVFGIVKMVLDKARADLAILGYVSLVFVIPACAVNAPHRRERVWIVAYNPCNVAYSCSDGPSKIPQKKGSGREGSGGNGLRLGVEGCGSKIRRRQTRADLLESRMGGAFNGFSERVHKGLVWADGWEEGTERIARNDTYERQDRIRALGNAVVPVLGYEIGRLILEANKLMRQEAC